MRRIFALLSLGFISLSSVTSFAQTRGFGAGALILDDNHGHSVTIMAPDSGTAEWNLWKSQGFPSLNWNIPVPPSSGAQGAFIYPGPLSYTNPPYLFAYWVPPGGHSVRGINDPDSGGTAGA